MLRLLPLVALLLAGPLCLEANPTGGSVAAGTAAIAGQGSSTVTVNQATNTAIINWQTFSIGSGELTKFIQPSSTSATLNRVLGGQTSFINGTLSANGQVYLINGNGIIVGAGGVISTAGFTGSTRDIADSDFLSGNLHFVGGSDAGVENLGTISALGGNVVLIGKTVDNAGTISAPDGTAALAAGDDVLLAQQNPDGSTVTVDPVSAPTPASTKIGVKNTGTIKASAAELKAANGNIYALAIQNTGLIQATTVTKQGGHIYLTADSGTIVNSGTLNASATAAKGVGGTILLKSTAGKVVHSGKLIARGGQGGKGGNAEISGAQIAVTGTDDLSASGGSFGDLLLDPATLNVITGGGNNPTASTVDPSEVDSLLSGGDLTLTALNNITVTNAISWNNSTTLTLQTTTANSTININAGITDSYSGEGGLTIHAASPTDAITTSINGTINVANFDLQQGAWKQLVNDGSNSGNIPATVTNNVTTYVLPSFTATNDFEISLTGATFLRANGGNGGDTYYGLVDIYGVQGMQGFLTSNFTLNGNYIDASTTANWNGGAGFVPIGSADAPFQGEFSNGGIENLTIDRPDEDNVGLFAVTGSSATLYSIVVEDSTITGGDDTGGLVGDNYGMVEYGGSYYGTVSGNQYVGGEVGYNEEDATVEYLEVYSSANGNSYVGGIVGENDGLVQGVLCIDSVSANTVDGTNGNIGGLVGYNYTTGTITNSYYSGAVTPADSQAFAVGGIAGENDGTISYCYTTPTSSVTGDDEVGGIAGYNIGLIEDSYNSGSVTGRTNYSGDGGDGGQYIGGIAGYNTQGSVGDFTESIDTASGDNSNPAMVQTSYNTGTVDGVQAIGGIVGFNDFSGTVTTCYNVGTIGDGDSIYVGGIVGDNYGYVTNVYDSGLVQGNSDSGTVAGIIGFDEDYADTENAYLDESTSGQGSFTNNTINNEDANAAYENNFAFVYSSGDVVTAYTQTGNNSGEGVDGNGAGYSYFGGSSSVDGTNGVYQIGTSPDEGGGPAWYIIEGQTRPMLAMEATEEIANPHELQLMAVNLGGYYYGSTGFDASPTNGSANPAEVWTTAGFDPIGAGAENYAFTGTVYGNYDTIQGLYINRPSTDNVGLFGYVGSGGSIQNVILNDASITGDNNVGGIAGTNYGSLSYDQDNTDYSPGQVLAEGDNVGGIVGDNFGQVTYSQNYSYEGSVTVAGIGNNIGGIAGRNEENGVVGEDTNNASIQEADGSDGSSAVGGIVGLNDGRVTQSINTGNVGSGYETNVGGLVGDNNGQIDDSYVNGGSLGGFHYLGGIVGYNEESGVVETSYTTVIPDPEGGPENGAVAGANYGTIKHVYWDDDTAPSFTPIGDNENIPGTIDVAGFSSSQLTDANNYAQGSSPQLWDFSPQNGDGGGIWGINVYTYMGTDEGGGMLNGLVNGGLPVLQWQTPINAKVTAVGGEEPYGYTPSYVVTGEGASQFATYVPNPTVNVAGGSDAGDSQTVAFSGTPNYYYYNVEYVNSSVDVVPDPLYISANSYTIASGTPTPDLGATYSGFQPGHAPSDPQLSGELELTVDPLPATTIGLHTINISGVTSPSGDYAITYIPGVLNVTTTTPTPTQELLTFETELGNIQTALGNDPTAGLEPFAFIIFPNVVGLGGDEDGAINDPKNDHDYAHAVGTHNLPSFSRLVTPGTGVVAIVDGVVIIGDPGTGKPVFLNQGGGFSQQVLQDLRGVLSPSVYSALLALIHGQ
jgi:filamentous hemagglutinin family protein